MRNILWMTAFFLIFSSGAQSREFADMVHELNALQNRMAIGAAAARDQAARQFDLIEHALEAEPATNWKDERNVRAAIVYLLCGGAPAKLREIHDAGLADGGLAPLLAASLEYAEGRNGGAPTALMAFDPRQFPATLGGHLALVQGGFLIGKDNARAIALLDLARLLLPGSLVEEAALRREIAILLSTRERDKLALLSARYASKYLASPFARNFWDVFRATSTSNDNPLSNSPQFDLVLEKAPASERFALYLAFSRAAMLSGDFHAARRDVEKAAAAASDPVARKRVAAYRLLLAALTDDQDRLELSALDRTVLNAEDMGLVKIVSNVVSRLAAPDETANDGASAESQEISEGINATVRLALEQCDELLRRGPRP